MHDDLLNIQGLSSVVDGCIRNRNTNSIEFAKEQFLEHIGVVNNGKEIHEKAINSIYMYLKGAIQCGCYFQVFEFLISSLDYPDKIDIKLLMSMLEKDEEMSEIINMVEKYKIHIEENMKALFGEVISDYNNQFKDICKFCEYLLNDILNKDINIKNITCKDIDKISEGIEKVKIPGVLFCIMDYIIHKNDEVFYYILSEYVIPIMADINWNEKSDYMNNLKALLKEYIEYLEIKIIPKEIFLTKNHGEDFWDMVAKDLIEKKEDKNIVIGREITQYTSDFGSNLLRLFENSREFIKDILKNSSYSFFASFTAFILQAEREEIKAKDFIVEYYEEMRNVREQAPYKIIMLIKAILASETFNETNIIYGYYLYEQTMYYRNEEAIFINVKNMCNLIEDFYKYICNSLIHKNEHDMFRGKKEYIKNSIFEELGLLENVRMIRTKYRFSKDKYKSEWYKHLLDILAALIDERGISVLVLASILERPQSCLEYDGYDKIYIGFPDELMVRAEGIYNNGKRYKKAALSTRKNNLFSKLDFVMKNLLLNQLDEEIIESMNKINKLRNQYVEDTNEFDGEFWEIVKPLYDSLQNRISAKYIHRNDITEYYMNLDKDLKCWDKLDKECKNMLITSEIVYRTLAKREDARVLDYSASMIPLTKVIEYILNQVFDNVKENINYREDFREEYDRNIYGKRIRETWVPKDSIELGPAIRMLCRGKINININRNTLYENNHFTVGNTPRPLAWHIDDFIDWSRLAELNGKQIYSCGFNDYECRNIILSTFTNNHEQNRIKFITSLEYIKNAYRNKVAHKDGIDKNRMDSCRENMLLAQKLIWILIYILK